jgi:hypothetical protein
MTTLLAIGAENLRFFNQIKYTTIIAIVKVSATVDKLRAMSTLYSNVFRQCIGFEVTIGVDVGLDGGDGDGDGGGEFDRE